ncbi:MAG: prepilin-type N-terminal cleavage/methylation domain-containing protein [Myxococcales bacterium]|nr:prepilin-type N-terminal cleavage/methylation domain-containing protein [Myxococcales bacterium]
MPSRTSGFVQQRKQCRHKVLAREGGFTLIELMIVVAIMSIIGVLSVTSLMRVLSRARSKKVTVARRAVAQSPLQVHRVYQREGISKIGGLIQSVSSSDIQAHLQVDYLLDQGSVVPVYHASFQATYLLRNPFSSTLPARVFFPFPKGAGTFSALQFQVAREDKRCVVPSKATSLPRPRVRKHGHSTTRPSVLHRRQVAVSGAISQDLLSCVLREPQSHLQMSTDGIAWFHRFPAHERVRVVIRYRVRGRDQFRYRIAAGKKKLFRFKMNITGVDPNIPPSALQPSSTSRLLAPQSHLFVWDFKDFLTSEHIQIRFPPQFSKYYRFSLLGKLAGFALLLFAFFFWYFGERERPEKITRLNFALVGVGFVSFFPLFIFLEDHLSMQWAFGVALGSAVLLTTVHVALFMGWLWSLFRSLPLQLLITLSFTFAVLFPAFRPLAFTVSALVLAAVLIGMNARYQREAREREAKEAEERKRFLEEEALRRKTAPKPVADLFGPPTVPDPFLKESLQDSQPQVAKSSKTTDLSTIGGMREEAKKPAPATCFCMFCDAKVEPHFKHCQECGAFLQRDYNCPSCQTRYWYPAVESFRFCRQCGVSMSPPPNPIPISPKAGS